MSAKRAADFITGEQGAMQSSPRGLTIVVCSDFGSINGGQAKVAIESAVGLKKQGHRVIFFAATGPVEKALIDAEVEVHCLDQYDLLSNPSRLSAAVQGIWNADAKAKLGVLLASLPKESTIVHVHGWAKALSPSIGPAIAASGLPAVYTLHEYFLYCPNGGFYNFQKSHACGLTPLSAQCWLTNCDSRNYSQKLWRNVRSLLADKVAHLTRVFSDVIMISRFQKSIVKPFVSTGTRLHHLPNPVTIEKLGPRPDPASGSFIFVGRLSAEKGAFLFAEAARRVGIAPVFVGDGPIAAEIGAKFPEAKMLGWQSGEAVAQLMRDARALVFPSLWYEGQPLTVLEAKGLGLPVVVSDGCAGRDEVENGVTGLWFKNNDVNDLARALLELRDDARVVAMSAASYQAYWTDPPTLDRHIHGLTAIYEGILAGRRNALPRTGREPAAVDPSVGVSSA